MSDIVIKVEGLSKLYRLGTIGTGSLRHDLQEWWHKKAGQREYVSSSNPAGSSEKAKYLWALKDVNMQVREGETWGIIGKNGAGKSTFLKILSRIIKPTTGSVKGKGKLGSLLEIGTGFHPELTGRENIFISGHILGMGKKEILKKFDEIVDFSGISAFIDTPIKRYSSGMYVRLAFAVAAHLEPDILIVDEVLAVGDVEFQKKCLGKMSEASAKQGRTIIFVSHNLQAVSNLCSKAIWLNHGAIAAEGEVKTVINQYLGTLQEKKWKQVFAPNDAPGNDLVKIYSVELVPHLANPLDIVDIRTPMTVKFSFFNAVSDAKLSVDLLLFTTSGECIFDIPSACSSYNQGIIEGQCTIPGNFLNDGSYYFSLYFVKDTSQELFSFNECIKFDVADFRENINWYDKWWGYVRPDFPLILKAGPGMPTV